MHGQIEWRSNGAFFQGWFNRCHPTVGILWEEVHEGEAATYGAGGSASDGGAAANATSADDLDTQNAEEGARATACFKVEFMLPDAGERAGQDGNADAADRRSFRTAFQRSKLVFKSKVLIPTSSAPVRNESPTQSLKSNFTRVAGSGMENELICRLAS